jgi:hypothetical protein
MLKKQDFSFIKMFGLRLGPQKRCGCGNEYFGAENICPDCFAKKDARGKQQQQETKLQVTRETIKSRILRDEYFGKYFETFGERFDKLIDGWCRVSDATGKKIMVELDKMDLWLLSNPSKHKKKWEQFITNWLSR